MVKRKPEEIVEGVTIDRQGTVVVAEGLQQTLCDIAIDLQECTPHAVDVEHVLAALVMAVRDGKLPRNSDINRTTGAQNEILARYVDVLFQRYDGNLDAQK